MKVLVSMVCIALLYLLKECEGSVIINSTGSGTQEEYLAVLVNYPSSNLVSNVIDSTTYKQQVAGYISYSLFVLSENCDIKQGLSSEELKNDQVNIIIININDIATYCTYTSKFLRKVQSMYTQIQGAIIAPPNYGDPGFLSKDGCRGPFEDTSDIHISLFEVSSQSFDPILSLVQTAQQDNSSHVYATMTPSQNPMYVLLSSPAYLASRYLLITCFSIAFLVSVYRLISVSGIPFTRFQKEFKGTLFFAIFFITLFALTRIVYHSLDPIQYTGSIQLASMEVLLFFGYWCILCSYTILCMMFVNIVRSVFNRSIYWKVRYGLWVAVALLLPCLVICNYVSDLLGITVVYLLFAVYLTFVVLFEAILMLYYGKEVIKVLHESTQMTKSVQVMILKKKVLFSFPFFFFFFFPFLFSFFCFLYVFLLFIFLLLSLSSFSRKQ